MSLAPSDVAAYDEYTTMNSSTLFPPKLKGCINSNSNNFHSNQSKQVCLTLHFGVKLSLKKVTTYSDPMVTYGNQF